MNRPLDYDRTMGRVSVVYRPGYGDGMCAMVACVDGWNDSCRTQVHRMSLEEVRDLRYMLDRLLAHAGKS